MLALLFDKKSKSYTLLSNYARTYASTIELSLLEITKGFKVRASILLSRLVIALGSYQ